MTMVGKGSNCKFIHRADVIRLPCSCKNRTVSSQECVCYKQNLCGTKLCPCQDSYLLLTLNIITSHQRPDNDEEEAAYDD